MAGTAEPQNPLRWASQPINTPVTNTPESAAGMVSTSSTSSSQDTVSPGSSVDLDKKSRPKRKRISPEQLRVLLGYFAETETPSYELRDKIGAELGMSNREVQIWHQNRRAKERMNRQKNQPHQCKPASRPPSEEYLPLSASPPPLLHSATADTSTASLGPIPTLPSYLDAGRRRSLSTSALISGSAMSVPAKGYSGAYQLENATFRPPTADPAVSYTGPVRPRLSRFHSSTSSQPYPRTLLPPAVTSPSWYNPTNSTAIYTSTIGRPRSLSGWVSGQYATYTNSQHTEATCIQLPLHLPTPPTCLHQLPFPSTDTAQSASSSLQSLADRRQTQLPPIRLLFDIADTAAFLSSSSSLSPGLGPSSAQSCPGLTSPFERLDMCSPGARSGYSDSAARSYFHDRTPTQNSRSPPITNPSFSFGRSFAAS